MCGNRMLGMGFCGQSELLLSVFLYDHLPFFNIQMQTKALERSRNEICD